MKAHIRLCFFGEEEGLVKTEKWGLFITNKGSKAMEKICKNPKFAPTDEELLGYYLKKQNLGDTSVIHNAISVVKICNYEPKLLPALSKIKSDDPVWYFFVPKDYTSKTMSGRKRTTVEGYWKVSGDDRKIKGVNGVEIGVKRTVVFLKGRAPNARSTPWVLHEYDDVPALQTAYVVCKVMYKGDDFIPFAGDSSSEPNHSLAPPEMNPVVSTQPEQSIQEENFDGNHLEVPRMVLPSLDVLYPNTLLNNNNPSVELQAPYSLAFHSNTLTAPPEMNPAVSAQHEPVQGENFNGLSVNPLEIPMMDLFPWDVLYQNTFSNNNNHTNVELQAPFSFHGVEGGYDPILPFINTNTLNMWPHNPYIAQHEPEGLWQHPNTFNAISNTPFGVGQQVEELDDFDPDSFINDYDPSYKLPTLSPGR